MNLDPDQRKKLLLVVASVGVAILLGDRVVLSPLLKSWQARQAQIAELQKRISKGDQLIARLKPVESRWNDMASNALPKATSVAEGRILDALDRWSRSASVNVTSVKPQWKQLDDDYSTFDCHVDATGNLASLTRFLYEVERDPLAIRVEAVELAARDSNASSLSLGLHVSGLLLNLRESR
jgi:Tfp pilus assembly protein PilO